jgi:hypothetical protein
MLTPISKKKNQFIIQHITSAVSAEEMVYINLESNDLPVLVEKDLFMVAFKALLS